MIKIKCRTMSKQYDDLSKCYIYNEKAKNGLYINNMEIDMTITEKGIGILHAIFTLNKGNKDALINSTK